MDRSEVFFDEIQSLEKDRLSRLKNLKNIIGEPDLLTILKASTFSSFLSHKKIYEREQKFIFGLNLPTTAHISSYINDRIHLQKTNNPKIQTQYKIRFYMYDIFKKIDFHIEINIPGSLQIKAHTLNGQPIHMNNINYKSVYLSSIIRSLYPHYYHPLSQMYGQVEQYSVLESFIRQVIPFVEDNQLEIPEELSEIQNLGLQMVINYIKKNQFWNLSKILKEQLDKMSEQKGAIFQLEIKYAKGQYRDIIREAASYLIRDRKNEDSYSLDFDARLLQLQAKSLCKIRKLSEAKTLGDHAIRKGLDDLTTWEQLLKVHYEGDEQNYFKLLNTAVNFAGQSTVLREKLQKAIIPRKIQKISAQQYLTTAQKLQRYKSLSFFPEFILQFDYCYLKQETNFKNLLTLLEKAQKQKSTCQMLSKLKNSIEQEPFFQKFITLFEKQKGWNKLIQVRADSFWLESDYANYQSSIRKKNNNNISFRFLNQSFADSDEEGKEERSASKQKDGKGSLTSSMKSTKTGAYQQSFDGQFSDVEEEGAEICEVAPCSKRIVTKRVVRQISNKKVETSKIICCFSLQKMFFNCYHNLKLQAQIEKWSSSLELTNMHILSKQKRELVAYIYIMKGLFHKIMLRYRKCEQSLKIARKYSNQTFISLVSCYALTKLYLQHNNQKGVEFYTVEMVRVLFTLGIEKFNIVPGWARQIIPYIIKIYGKAITKRLQGPLKEIVELWLRIDNNTEGSPLKH